MNILAVTFMAGLCLAAQQGKMPEDCECGSIRDPQAHHAVSDSVFIGELVSARSLENEPVRMAGRDCPVEVGTLNQVEGTFRVLLPVKGSMVAGQEIQVKTLGASWGCGVGIWYTDRDRLKGSQWVIYANWNPDDSVFVTLKCDRTAELKEAEEDVKFFSTLAKPKG